MSYRKKILIVEDEDVIAMAMQYSLEELGYEVTDRMRSGEEALASVGKNIPDIILMDIKIDGRMDGIETAAIIHKTYNIPVIFLTSYSNSETLERAKQTNPFGYIIKPYQDRELYTTIELTYHKHRYETKLIESERKYRELTESIHHIVVEFELDGKINFLNKAGKHRLEISEKKIAEGCYLNQVMEKAVFDQLFLSLFDGKAEIKGDLILRSFGGQNIHVQYFLSPVFKHNKITGYRGVMDDISEQVIKNRLHHLYENITLRSAVFSFNHSLLIEYVLKSLHTIFPYLDEIYYCNTSEKDNWRYVTLAGSITKNNAAILTEYIVRKRRAFHLQGEKIREFLRVNRSDSEIKIKCFAGFPFYTEGELNGVLVMTSYTDSNLVSSSCFPVIAEFLQSVQLFIEKNLLTAKVKASDNKYSQLIESINQGVVQMDCDGRILFANNRFCEIAGLNYKEVLGMNGYSLLDDFPEKKRALMEQISPGGALSNEHYEIRIKNKNSKHIIVNASPLLDEKNKLTGSISTWIDVTENKTLSSQLSETEKKLKEIADNISGAFWTINWKLHTMEFVNPAFYDIFGIHPESEGISTYEAWRQLAIDTCHHPIINSEKLSPLHNSYDIQYKIRTSSGDVKWIHEKATLIYNALGEIDRIVGYSTDITIRKSAEERLGKSKEEKEAILSQLLDTIITVGSNGEIKDAYIKKNEESLFHSTKFVVGKNISDVLPLSITEMLYSFITVGSNNQNTHIFEYEHKKDIESKWFELRIVRGSNRNLIVIIRNISHEKHYFIEMRKFYNIISQTNELIMITDSRGRIEFTNDTFTRITGYDMSEILGKQPRFLNSGKHPRKFYNTMWSTILANKSFSAEFVNRKKNGDLYYEEKIITPLVNEKGEITKFISTGRDITEKKIAEKKLLAYERQKKLQEKRTEKLRTTALIQGQELERMRLARELHDGLGQILSATKFNIEHFTKSDFKNTLSEVRLRSIKKLIINSINETRKISDNLSPVGLTDYGLEYVVRKMISEIAAGKVINMKLISNLKRMRFEPSIEINLFRIVQEAVNNALKHSESKNIIVKLNFKDEILRVKITDDGIGISIEILSDGKNKRYGLRNIKERAKIINADCKICAGKKTGTEIDIQLKTQKLKP